MIRLKVIAGYLYYLLLHYQVNNAVDITKHEVLFSFDCAFFIYGYIYIYKMYVLISPSGEM